jgi:Tfp pilus assembly protein PilN
VRELNLAGRPFVNLKPVRRAGLLLLLLAVILLVVNGVLYWKHFTGEGQIRNRSQALARQIASEEAEVARLRGQLSALDITGMNRRAEFVNLEIDRRRFAWSRLFDRVAKVQPDAVRLTSMTPRFGGENQSRSRRRVRSDEVNLELHGVAKNGEALLEFIDALFEHPAFRDPDLSRESRRQDGMLNFDLSVLYLPTAEEPSADPTVDADASSEAASGSDGEAEA